MDDANKHGKEFILLHQKATSKPPDLSKEESDFGVAIYPHDGNINNIDPNAFLWFKVKAVRSYEP